MASHRPRIPINNRHNARTERGEMMTQDLIAPGTPYMPAAESVEWGTPKYIFDPLNEEFHFTLDVCAQPWNAKCPKYFTPEVDGLKQRWDGVCWCNPPYGAKEITRWLDRGFHEAGYSGATTVFLLPNTTDVIWFHKYVWDEQTNATYFGVELRFFKGRIKFDAPPGYTGDNPGPGKGNILVIVRPT